MPTEMYRMVRLANGTQSIHSVADGETFHPVIGPAAEARALYVDQLDLPARIRERSGELILWDVGMGAGANPLAILRATRETAAHLRIVSFDRTDAALTFALQHSSELGFLQGYELHLQKLIEEGEVGFGAGGQRVDWTFVKGDFPAVIRGMVAKKVKALPAPDVVLFDAFSPARNPDMWTLPLFSDLFALLDPGRPCLLPTYSRSTMLRVTLLLAGFFVGVGHPTGEKEETTLAASARRLVAEPLDAGWLQRARKSTSAEPLLDGTYRQAPLTQATFEKLKRHSQFSQP